jgi:hypothetical protein
MDWEETMKWTLEGRGKDFFDLGQDQVQVPRKHWK